MVAAITPPTYPLVIANMMRVFVVVVAAVILLVVLKVADIA